MMVLKEIKAYFKACFNYKNNSSKSRDRHNSPGDNADRDVNKNIHINIIQEDPKKISSSPKSPLQDIQRFIKDPETEKDYFCKDCRRDVHLSFEEPKEHSGNVEIKTTVCPSCKAPIGFWRKVIKKFSPPGLFGKVTERTEYGDWKELNLK